MAPKATVAAVETNIFPLYEVFNGTDYVMSYASKGLKVESYLSLQGRYKHLGPEEIRTIQAETDRAWKELQRKAGQIEC